MKGKPKYKEGDKVKFMFDEKLWEGIIWIVDKYGTWDDPSDASYDIMVDNWIPPYAPERGPEKCLFKHITEKRVIELIIENNDTVL